MEHLFFYGTHREQLKAPKERMLVSELKEIVGKHVEGFNAGEPLVLEEHAQHPDRLLRDEEEVPMQGIPHFYSEAHLREFRIIVNAEPKEVTKRVLTFEEIVAIAFPNPLTGVNIKYTVHYDKALWPHHDGDLAPTQLVKIKNGTIFNVAQTDKS